MHINIALFVSCCLSSFALGLSISNIVWQLNMFNIIKSKTDKGGDIDNG